MNKIPIQAKTIFLKNAVLNTGINRAMQLNPMVLLFFSAMLVLVITQNEY